ncbi:MAG: hypothetical protein ACYC3I_12130 [Gemmataceae bacterium]
MNFQIDVSSAVPAPPAEPPTSTAGVTETVELLRQLLEVQREQLTYQRAAAVAHDMTARWRAFLNRWQPDFPDLADGCRKALPHLERCYGHLLRELTDKLNEEEQGLENEFVLQEFLDRFGMRLAQLGTILNLVAPLAEAANTSQGESAS